MNQYVDAELEVVYFHNVVRTTDFGSDAGNGDIVEETCPKTPDSCVGKLDDIGWDL